MTRCAVTVAFAALLLARPSAVDDPLPTTRLISATPLNVPGAVDSNIPMTWDLVEGTPRLFALASWGGIPALLAGPALERLQREVDSVDFRPHPGHGVWIESLLADEGGTWYGFYHHEVPADVCGRADREIPRIGAAKSADRGRTWIDLGAILEAPPGSHACNSTNRFVLGGVGDLSAMLDEDKQDVYLFFSQYSQDPQTQGVAVGRLAWADRDAPAGRVAVWRDGAWIPPRSIGEESEAASVAWEYPSGTPLVTVTKPWHDGNAAADAFWGPSIHWNTYLERYVMLLNRTKNENFDNEGIYVSYSRSLMDPGSWSAPQKVMSGGGWYPQVAGLESETGTDKVAGQRARFFLTGKSQQLIEFRK